MRNRRFNRLTFVLLAVTFNMSQVSAEDRPKFLVLELDIDFTNGRDVLQEVHNAKNKREFHAIAGALHVRPEAVGAANVGTSFNIPNPTSEERRATFPAPSGYTTCRVDQLSYEPKFQAGPSDVTWNMTVKPGAAEAVAAIVAGYAGGAVAALILTRQPTREAAVRTEPAP